MRADGSGDTAATRRRWLSARGWVLAGLAVFALVFVGGGLWAALSRISGAVIAPGVVSPESGIKTVQHREGGTVREIRVRPGERVERGQVLLVLDDVLLQTELGVVLARLHALLAEGARLEAERDGADDIVFADVLLKLGDDPEIRRLLKTQRALFSARRNMLESQKRILEQKKAALEQQINGLEAQLRANARQQALIGEEIATVKALLGKGQARKPRLLALRRAAADMEGMRGQLLAAVARNRKSIAEIDLQITGMRRDFLAKVLDRLAEVQKEIRVLQSREAELRARLERTRIRAPVTGRVLDVTVRTVGGVVSPGQPIARIVPERETLIVEAQVRPTDIDEVRIGQQARVSFTAFASFTMPPLLGRVRQLSPAPLTDKNGEQSHFRVEVAVPPEEIAKLGRNRHLVPGMPAEVFITTRERTPLELLASPLTDALRRALRSD